MRVSEMHQGDYIIRTKELSWASVLSGAICYVEGVTKDALHIRLTDDCVPQNKVYAIPVNGGDDGYWHDVTSIVMAANSCIRPEEDEYQYDTVVSAAYRNSLGLDKVYSPLSYNDLEGKVCLIGQSTPNGVSFSKTGYYIVATDSDGYVTAYQGYCSPRDGRANASSKLVVLNLSASKRLFYDAEPILEACSNAYHEDMLLADKYVEVVRQKTSVRSTDAYVAGGMNSVLSELRLGV